MLLRRGNALSSIKSLSSVNLVCSTRQSSPDSFAKIALEQRSGKGISKIPSGNSENERSRIDRDASARCSRKAVRLLGRLVGARDCSFRTDFPKHPQNGNPSSLWCCRGPAVSRERSREGNLAESAGRSPRGSASSCATGSTTTTYAAYWRPSEMEEKSSARFSEYLFAKMDGQDVSASQGPRKVTADTRKFVRENLLLVVTLSGVLFGVILGFGLRPLGLGDDAIMLISYPGELFMRLLKLMILPLVIASLISGSASLNARMNGMIAVRTLVYFILSSLLNAVLGVVLVLLIHPGNPGIRKSIATSHSGRAVNILDSLLDLGRNMFPDNIFQAAFQQAHTVYVPKTPPFRNLTDSISSDVLGDEELMRVTQYRSGTNTLGIVFFCLVFGTFLGTLGEKGQIVIDFFKAVFEVIMRMVSTVMWMTPVGITSVIAGKILGVADLALVMSQLAWFIVTIVIGVFFYQLVIMQLIYLAFVRKNPFKFYAGLAQGTLTAFAMASTRKSADSVSPGLILGVEAFKGFHYPNLLPLVRGRTEEDETAKTGFVPLMLFI
ncbi:Excitatory amino acid transporter [Eufriesea mexicana]|nr:Excitatory amino acid transporter [Eufriesea mexicana]